MPRLPKPAKPIGRPTISAYGKQRETTIRLSPIAVAYWAKQGEETASRNATDYLERVAAAADSAGPVKVVAARPAYARVAETVVQTIKLTPEAFGHWQAVGGGWIGRGVRITLEEVARQGEPAMAEAAGRVT